jgi:hypothetical protein
MWAKETHGSSGSLGSGEWKVCVKVTHGGAPRRKYNDIERQNQDNLLRRHSVLCGCVGRLMDVGYDPNNEDWNNEWKQAVDADLRG